VLLDETQSLPDGGHELFASVRPMLATTGGRMIVLGTPLDRSGLPFDIWEGGIAMDWTRVHVPSTLCLRIPAAFLESERKLLGEAIFRREYLAEFAASGSGMFDHDLLQGAVLPDDFVFDQGSRTNPATGVWQNMNHATGAPPKSPTAPAVTIDTTRTPARSSRYANAVLP
jgi:hypothetical protein